MQLFWCSVKFNKFYTNKSWDKELENNKFEEKRSFEEKKDFQEKMIWTRIPRFSTIEYTMLLLSNFMSWKLRFGI
ncbi:unnamed protein product [Blepharisma stoltei]|uniref:Uncharacterized protein n=1 Tax=Blepharisma stoltei TaxID=1481888 RepID=A0AAU9IH61_9CILI|nr:unnamed protein product [Blepharisma stoltei]